MAKITTFFASGSAVCGHLGRWSRLTTATPGWERTPRRRKREWRGGKRGRGPGRWRGEERRRRWRRIFRATEAARCRHFSRRGGWSVVRWRFVYLNVATHEYSLLFQRLWFLLKNIFFQFRDWQNKWFIYLELQYTPDTERRWLQPPPHPISRCPATKSNNRELGKKLRIRTSLVRRGAPRIKINSRPSDNIKILWDFARF